MGERWMCSMDLVVTGRNIEVSEALLEYADRKIGRLINHLQTITEAKLELSRARSKMEGPLHVVQVTIDSNGTILRVEKRAADFYAAIDAAADVLDRQIQRYKGRFYRKRKEATPVEEQAEVEEEVEEEPLGEVVKIKRFPVKPMSTEEAIEQMELLGHNFFLFFDEVSQKYCVVYRRNDGDYGLIEPELG